MIRPGRQHRILLLSHYLFDGGEINSLDKLLESVFSSENFCTAHELVNRNHITSNKKKILKESLHLKLRTFRFLINKN